MRDVQAELDAPPTGYPDVNEQAVLDRYAAEQDRRLAELGVIAPRESGGVPEPGDDEDGERHYFSDGWGNVGEGY